MHDEAGVGDGADSGHCDVNWRLTVAIVSYLETKQMPARDKS